MKIEKIKLNNIQSHKNTVLELSPGVNVIKGRSHSGKSSIIRGIRWLFFNQPKGIDLRSWGVDEKKQIDFSIKFGKHEIKRFKKGLENGYYLDKEKFKAIRFEVPQEIKDSFPITPINFQHQSELYFLFNNSPGEVAEKLNEIAKISEVDKCYKTINAIIRKTSHEVNSLKSRIDRTEKELVHLKWVDDAKKIFDQIDSKLETWGTLESEVTAIDFWIKKIKQHEQEVRDLKEKLTIKPKVKIIRKLVEKRKQLQNDYLGLQYLIVGIAEAEGIVENLKVVHELKARYTELKDLQKKSRSVAENCISLSKMIADTENKISRKETLNVKLRSLKAQRDKIFSEHNEDFCAYCGAFRTHWRND